MEQVVFVPPAQTTDDLTAAIEQMMQEHRGRFTIFFRHPVDVYMNFTGRHRHKIVEHLPGVKFFHDSRTRTLCYTVHDRHGFYLRDLPAAEVLAIQPEIELSQGEKLQEKLRKIRAIQRRIHPNAWDDLKQDPPEKFKDLGLAFSIKDKFPEFVIEHLKDAFKYKWDYERKEYGPRRDLSVSTKLGDDGIFRAWFSSEYSGCGNGCYYVLINPTTAAFGEYD